MAYDLAGMLAVEAHAVARGVSLQEELRSVGHNVPDKAQARVDFASRTAYTEILDTEMTSDCHPYTLTELYKVLGDEWLHRLLKELSLEDFYTETNYGDILALAKLSRDGVFRASHLYLIRFVADVFNKAILDESTPNISNGANFEGVDDAVTTSIKLILSGIGKENLIHVLGLGKRRTSDVDVTYGEIDGVEYIVVSDSDYSIKVKI